MPLLWLSPDDEVVADVSRYIDFYCASHTYDTATDTVTTEDSQLVGGCMRAAAVESIGHQRKLLPEQDEGRMKSWSRNKGW